MVVVAYVVVVVVFVFEVVVAFAFVVVVTPGSVVVVELLFPPQDTSEIVSVSITAASKSAIIFFISVFFLFCVM